MKSQRRMKSMPGFIPLWMFLLMFITLKSCTQPVEKDTEIVYGPIEKTYQLPDVSGTIYFVSPNGDAASDGSTPEQPTTIEKAFSRVVGGDAIVLRGGTYRTGDLMFNQGITIQAYRDEKPILNGTLVADSWELIEEGLWATNWEFLFPAGPEDWWHRERNEEFTPMHRFNNDGIFVDGQFLQSAGSTDEVDEGTYFVDYDNNKIYIGVNPEGKSIEITAFRKALHRVTYSVHGKTPDDRGPIIRGITFTQYPDTMVHIGGVGLAIDQHGRDVVGTKFENCTFSNNFRIAMFALSDSLVMRNCNVFNTNAEGVYVVASNDVLLERNIFENNNIEQWTGFYPSSVKIFNQSHRAVVRENLVRNHAHSNGVWWDVGNLDGFFINNHVENVAHSGFFHEISDRITVAGNVFVNCDQSIFVLNAANAKIYNNTMINSKVNVRRDSRGDQLGTFGWHVTLGPGVEERDRHIFVNNLMIMTEDNDSPMVMAGQPAHMCDRLTTPHFSTFNNNVFVRYYNVEGDKPALIDWSPYSNEECLRKFYTSGELNEFLSQFSSDCIYIDNYEGDVFVDIENNIFKLSTDFVGLGNPTRIPEQVLTMMGVSIDKEPFIGAIAP
ncbi:right-handed parallel beta-helix repeat-containing protein [Natronoflexus pectinivorans]|uniref:Parallel beta-helix repeat protein n=1 Tax=Natronoflexus pectinivorans TaxID=682526 RepID=A0A4R2GKR1_9BACT|nr:right-handed parallel beta-helix repeat-containing protein [Natronoflexus pectinivorans]TCO09382.1 parallel beta-helix repeat protein [Natronoflexus pectinivorans]